VKVYNDAGSVVSTSLLGHAPSNIPDIKVDIALDFNGSNAKLYINGTLRQTTPVNLAVTTDPTLHSVEFYTPRFSNGGAGWSEMIITQGEATLGWRLASVYAQAVDSSDFATGDHSSINENAFSASSYLESSGGEATAFFDYTALPALPANSYVRGVTIKSNGTADIGSSPYLSNAVKIGGVEYVLPSMNIESLGYRMDSNQFLEKNPATAGDWTVADINSALFGVKVTDNAN
jgi:hypothetical protein